MRKMALRRKLAAALPVVAIVAMLVGLFARSDVGERRSRVAGAIVDIPAAMSTGTGAAGGPSIATPALVEDRARQDTQVCSGVWIPLRPDGSPDPWTLLEVIDAQHARLKEEVVGRLLSGDDQLERATALRLRVLSVIYGSSNRHRELPSGVIEAHRELVNLGVGSRAPELYASALGACKASGFNSLLARPAACDLLSTAQWAQLEPDNAIPWLVRAEEAQKDGDTIAVDDALRRALHAKRYETLQKTFTRHVVRRLPTDESFALAWPVFVDEVEATYVLMAPRIIGPALRSCSESAVVEPARRELCEGLANRMLNEADTLWDQDIGRQLGERLGWTRDRMAAIDQATLAYRVAAAKELDPGPGTCRVERASVSRMRTVANLGEVGAVRQAFERAAAASAPLPLR